MEGPRSKGSLSSPMLRSCSKFASRSRDHCGDKLARSFTAPVWKRRDMAGGGTSAAAERSTDRIRWLGRHLPESIYTLQGGRVVAAVKGVVAAVKGSGFNTTRGLAERIQELLCRSERNTTACSRRRPAIFSNASVAATRTVLDRSAMRAASANTARSSASSTSWVRTCARGRECYRAPQDCARTVAHKDTWL